MSGWHVLKVTPEGPNPTALPDLPRPLLLVFPSSIEGEELAAAMAAANGATVVGRMASLRRDGENLVVSRRSHGGRIAVRLRIRERLAVATANDMPEHDGEIVLGAPADSSLEQIALGDQPRSLESASVVISGGRGLDADGFALLEQISESVGGALGASLAAVDLGLAPVSRQIGQSGKFVTPHVYLAVGMSGTPQHLAGIGSATRIIAVNSDPEAPIFRFAETGALADAQTLLPLINQALQTPAGDRK